MLTSSPYYQRCVLVRFRKDADQSVIDNFKLGLRLLADGADGLVSMTTAELHVINHECELSRQIPNVSFPDYMSTWIFSSEQHLEKFVSSTMHQNIAEQYFKPAVSARTVFNCAVAEPGSHSNSWRSA